jgi:hypothetical protein
VKLAIGRLEQCTLYVHSLPIKVGDFLDHVNFMIAPLLEHDNVLDMDWLIVNNVYIQCLKHQAILWDKNKVVCHTLEEIIDT